MPKIVVVDDEVNQLRALAIGLRLEGFDVRTATDATMGLAMLAAEAAALAIVDLMLPGTNGIELSRQLHAIYPAMPVILTSAYHLSERQLVRTDCGVVAFLPKPYDLPELAAFIRTKLASSPQSAQRAALAR